MSHKHTMYLTSKTAVALWNNELTGQISDGMWENTKPDDHYEFWCDTEAVYHPTNVEVVTETPWRIRKSNYSFSKLIEYVGDRMLNLGRLTKVTGEIYAHLRESEYLPETEEAFLKLRQSEKYPGEYVKKIGLNVAHKYYTESTYSLKELRADMNLIRAAMHNVKDIS